MISWLNLLQLPKTETTDLVCIEENTELVKWNSVKYETTSYRFDFETSTVIRKRNRIMTENERQEAQAEFDKLMPKRFQKKADIALKIPAGGDLGRGGSDEKLIKSMISKVSETDWDIPSINKLLKKLADVTLEIGTNDKLLRILAELEKPIPEPTIFVEGWVNPLPRHRRLDVVEKPKRSTPSIESYIGLHKMLWASRSV